MNYATLLAQVQQYLQNDEATFVAQIPTFVQLAERKIYNDAQLPVTRKNVTATLTTSNPLVGVPTDFNSIYELSLSVSGSAQFLINKDVSFIREMYPSSATTGVPVYYAMFDHQNILVGPAPDSGYTAEMHYYYYPTSIVTASTTWLGDRFENALLYGTLLQGYTNMKGDQDMFGVYKAAYDEAMEAVKVFSTGKARSDTYRSGQYRAPVMK
jgi:hypothetical protein